MRHTYKSKLLHASHVVKGLPADATTDATRRDATVRGRGVPPAWTKSRNKGPPHGENKHVNSNKRDERLPRLYAVVSLSVVPVQHLPPVDSPSNNQGFLVEFTFQDVASLGNEVRPKNTDD